MQIYVFKNTPYNTSLKAKEVALRDFIKAHFYAEIRKVTERIIPINNNNAKIVLKIHWEIGCSKRISKRTITCREVLGSGFANAELLNVAKAIEEEEQRNRNHKAQFHSDDLTNWRGR